MSDLTSDNFDQATVAERVSAALVVQRKRVTIDEMKELIVTTVSTDRAMRLLLGIRPPYSDPRVYAYYAPTATVDDQRPAYITYANTAFPEETRAVGEPVFNLAIWALDWDIANRVRDRLVDLFDERPQLTTKGVALFTKRIMEHDNYQENTKFASIVVQFRFGFSRV